MKWPSKLSLLVGSVVLVCVLYLMYRGGKKLRYKADKHKCGAIDPVSSPDYNMKEIAKQSILLEEHLAERNKRCKDCICKHFFHIIGLAEEALCLAGSQVNKYPLMDSCPTFYKDLFDTWMANKSDEGTMLAVMDELRKRRKELVKTYVLNASSDRANLPAPKTCSSCGG